MKFKDRSDAGRQLAASLKACGGKPGLLVLALPRGGVVVAAEIAKGLNAPLDAFLMQKLGVPGRDALIMGMITTGGIRVLNDEVVSYLGIPEETIEAVTRKEQRELERRERPYRCGRPAPDVRGKIVILVDDGLTPGATMQAALTALRKQRPASLIVAIPVIARTTREAIERLSDEIISLGAQPPPSSPPDGIWYEDPSQPTDIEASNLLADLLQPPPPNGNSSAAEDSPATAKISNDTVKKPRE